MPALCTPPRPTPAQREGSAAASGSEGGQPQRNVVRINLRQQTAKPRYSELSDDEGMDTGGARAAGGQAGGGGAAAVAAGAEAATAACVLRRASRQHFRYKRCMC